ncbi:MAG: nicotinate dehydrogenase subunit [Hyphomicrobiales bacterium]|jgi:CO/xanthine dehydrogenase Mo-binding subunit|nr:nicotinate dehydrogenase subunit [Hyphomicrobiales bacterium]
MNAVFSRRDFAKGFGGLVLAFTLDLPALAQDKPKLPGSLDNNRMLDAWIRINADGTATVFTGKVELGQGILTALAQIAAEELALPLSRIAMISGDTGRTPNEGVTSGSQSIENSGTALRLAAAEVRMILLEIAAPRLAASAEQLTVGDGVVSAPNGNKVTYGDLASTIDLRREATAKAKPNPPGTHRIVGQSIARFDIPGKVTGKAMYVQDMRPPGMVHGRVVRPPHYGATLASLDDAKARALAGVIAIVRDGSFLGVIAEREEQAVRAREVLAQATWKDGPQLPDPARLFAHLKSLPTKTSVISDKQSGVPAGARVLEATYTKPYMAHASVGPSCALALWQDGKVTVWTHSQGVFPLRAELVKALKVPAASIRCIHVEGSGCYGHNGADDVALDAALLARAVPGKPVRLQWMRDDEFAWEPFGPAMSMQAKGAVAGGRIVDWQYEVWSNSHSTRPMSTSGANVLAAWHLAEPQPMGPPTTPPQPAGGGDRNAIPLYDFPNQRVVHHFVQDMPLRVSALRTLGAYANVFASESFMDELAAAAGADPVAFRLAHLTDPRAKAVIEKAAEMAGWKPDQKGDGIRGRGIGFSKYKNLACYVAVVAEVEVDRASGRVRVTRSFAATDAGLVINPDGLINQIEGGIIQGTSWTLHEEVQFASTGILSRDWSNYPILTMPEVPHVTVALINRPSERSLGAGEGSQGPIVAAIANAFAHATGKRIRELPFHPARVKAVLG